ncbi:hypothetical protein GGI05_002662 [Coemansia sp. RSA 2603]|nr:hypothetical protein GGI05_002662 [Coemansia sp. RSA 2603]
MDNSDFSRYPCAQPRERIKLVNYDKDKVANTHTKLEYAFYYTGYESENFGSAHIIMEAKQAQFEDGLPDEVLGQMAYCAQCVWNEQFTRIFVAVIFLHGTKIDIFVFARSGYQRVALGQLIHNASCYTRYATVKRVDCEKDSTVKITGRISRAVDIWRRAAYLLKVLYQGKEAVLKLSWIPVSRQPEGVLYDLMSQSCHGVDYIAKVFCSGILISNFLGYRLEFILMEYCGEPLIDVFKRNGENPNKKNCLLGLAEDAIKKISTCLLQARSAGVYHRDVSAGNITLRGQDVFLIDWGYGKVILDALDSRQKEKVNAEWGIDINNLTANEDARDGMTADVLG